MEGASRNRVKIKLVAGDDTYEANSSAPSTQKPIGARGTQAGRRLHVANIKRSGRCAMGDTVIESGAARSGAAG